MREILRDHIGDMAALKVHMQEERLASDAVDPLDRFVDGVPVVDAPRALRFFHPLGESQIAPLCGGGSLERLGMKEPIETGWPMVINHSSPLFVLRGED